MAKYCHPKMDHDRNISIKKTVSCCGTSTKCGLSGMCSNIYSQNWLSFPEHFPLKYEMEINVELTHSQEEGYAFLYV